jgi:malate synthase
MPILWLLLLSFLKRSFIGDFEDSNLPFISNNLEGQVNLRNAINKSISFYNEKKDKTYALDKETDILLVRSRGLHLNLKHFLIAEEEMAGSFVAFGLFFLDNIKTLQAQGSANYFYLLKLEHYLETRLWNEVFVFSQAYLSIPQKTIKVTI